MSKMTTGQRWHSTSNQRQRRPLTDVGPTLEIRHCNVEPISRANVDPISKMTTGQRWHSTSNQRQRRPLTDVGPTSLCRLGYKTKYSCAAILVRGRDHQTQFWKRTIQWLFYQSLVPIEQLKGSRQEDFYVNFP